LSDLEYPLNLPIAACLNPKPTIESPGLDRFAHMFRRDLIACLEIGDRARHPQDSIIGASAEIQPVIATRISSCDSSLSLQCCLIWHGPSRALQWIANELIMTDPANLLTLQSRALSELQLGAPAFQNPRRLENEISPSPRRQPSLRFVKNGEIRHNSQSLDRIFRVCAGRSGGLDVIQ